jgi:hypothetical protein
MKLTHISDYKVSGFPFAGGWRLHIHHSTWPAEQSYWFSSGKFYQYQVELEPNMMNAAVFSQMIPASPEPGAEQAMYTAIVKWNSEEPTAERA